MSLVNAEARSASPEEQGTSRPAANQIEASREILAWVQRVIDACGPRPAGSQACLASARLVADGLRETCDRVEIQEFSCRPGAFLGFLVGSAVVSAAASALLFAGFVKVALALFLLLAALNVVQFGLYREVIDRAFPERPCANVVGSIEPEGPVKRQIIVSGHHDSAYEFRYLRLSPYLYLALNAWYGLGVTAMPVALTGLLVAQGLGIFAAPDAVLRGLALFTGVPALLFTASFGRRPVPGAGDNLVSSGIALHVAKVFRERLRADSEALAGTRLLLVSFDGEEAGLRGSRAFAKRNLAQLTSVPTVMLNLESFYKLKDLSVLVSDLNGFRKLSRRVAQMWVDEAKAEGLEVQPLKLSYGLGATDAAELAKIGVEASTLIGVPTSPVGHGHTVYHSRDDLPRNIEPSVVDAASRLTLRMIDRLAREPNEAAGIGIQALARNSSGLV